jgi:hypothetical protein
MNDIAKGHIHASLSPFKLNFTFWFRVVFLYNCDNKTLNSAIYCVIYVQWHIVPTYYIVCFFIETKLKINKWNWILKGDQRQRSLCITDRSPGDDLLLLHAIIYIAEEVGKSINVTSVLNVKGRSWIEAFGRLLYYLFWAWLVPEAKLLAIIYLNKLSLFTILSFCVPLYC